MPQRRHIAPQQRHAPCHGAFATCLSTLPPSTNRDRFCPVSPTSVRCFWAQEQQPCLGASQRRPLPGNAHPAPLCRSTSRLPSHVPPNTCCVRPLPSLPSSFPGTSTSAAHGIGSGGDDDDGCGKCGCGRVCTGVAGARARTDGGVGGGGLGFPELTGFCVSGLLRVWWSVRGCVCAYLSARPLCLVPRRFVRSFDLDLARAVEVNLCLICCVRPCCGAQAAAARSALFVSGGCGCGVF